MGINLNTLERIDTEFSDCLQQRDLSLEQQFLRDHVDILVDTEQKSWGDEQYLSPNEKAPDQVEEHLFLMNDMDPGLIVSTGTERSFFNLILSPKKQCTGLVIRDINPKVKAYNDFLVLLLRISSSREDFCKLVSEPFNNNTKSEVLHRIEQSNIPLEMQLYYIRNIDSFAKIYYPIQHRIISKYDNFGASYAQKVDYWSDDACFDKLKRYADAGKIISTIGDIGDLDFLNHQSISIVDTSNIGDYFILDINCNNFPRIIWNAQFRKFHGTSRYRSYKHEPLTLEEKDKFDEFFSKTYEMMRSKIEGPFDLPFLARVLIDSITQDITYGTELYQDKIDWNYSRRFASIDPFNDPAPHSYSKTILKAFEMLIGNSPDNRCLQRAVQENLQFHISDP